MTFSPYYDSQRPALLLFNGYVYIAFGSAGDLDPYNGWLLVYNATTLAQVQAFNSTPNGGGTARGAFWMSGAGPSADASFVYLASANGVFDDTSNTVPPVAPNNDMGDSLLKFNALSAGSTTLTLQDFFTPSNQADDAANDQDFGTGGAVVLPDSMGSAAHPHLAVVPDKNGSLWLVDRDSMGTYAGGGTDRNVQNFNTGSGLRATPAVWGNTLYIAPYGSPLMAFPVAGATISASTSQSTDSFAEQGATVSVSARGATNGIVWALDTGANGASSNNGWGPAILRAYDANDLGTRLYTSSAVAADACGYAVKFTVPTIANGKIYVGGAAGSSSTPTGQLTAYGLKP